MQAPQSEPDDLESRLRQRLGDTLAFERELGGGGMSRVFLAYDPALHRRVVVKVLHGAGGGVSVERFRREMQLAASLQHPHIVPVLSAGDLDGTPWYSMPWIEGRSLRDRIASDGPLPIRDVLRILRDVARGFTYAHARGVVHRDIKPENVLLTGDAAVIIDFGIAKALSDAHAATTHGEGALTRMGFTLGTPTYMAPEQAAADPSLDHRADIYAFGVMAFELVTGRPPFESSSSQQLLKAHMADPVPSLAQFRAGVPAGLVDLVNACLAKSPGDRPHNAEAVVERIEELLAGTSGEMLAARSRSRWYLGAGVGVAAASLLAVFLIGGQRGQSPVTQRMAASVAVLQFIPRGDDSASAWLAAGISDDVAAQLLTLGGIQVAPRLAVEQAGRSPLPPDQLAETLGVATLLDGVVRREGSELRVIAQLVEAHTGAVLWTGTYRERPESVGGVVDEIVGSVRGALLADTDTVRSERSSRDPTAYADYLRGRSLVALRVDTAIVAGVAVLESVIARDSAFGAAWAALADALLLLPLYAGVPSAVVTDRAESAVERALYLDPELPAALHTRGQVKRARWQWDAAEADYRLALSRAPSAESEQALGEVLLVRGDNAGAVAAFRRARALVPSSAVLAVLDGVASALAGRRDQAQAAITAALSADSSNGTVHFLAGSAWLYLGDPHSGMMALRRASELAPGQPLLRGILSQALARSGDLAAARRIRDGLLADGERAGAAGGLAHAHLGVGDIDAALDALERAAREQDPIFAAEPLRTALFAEVQSHPRFRAVLRQVGLASPTGERSGS